MTKPHREKLVGVVISLPTFCDDGFNLLLDRQRKHIRWLIDHGAKEGSAVLMVNGGLGEGYFLSEEEFQHMVDVLADEARGEGADDGGHLRAERPCCSQEGSLCSQSGD